jgi:hypothetical protein
LLDLLVAEQKLSETGVNDGIYTPIYNPLPPCLLEKASLYHPFSIINPNKELRHSMLAVSQHKYNLLLIYTLFSLVEAKAKSHIR